MVASTVKYEIKDKIATITLNRPETYNAFRAEDYVALSDAMYEIDKRDDVWCTVWQGNGKWFCSGAYVAGEEVSGTPENPRHAALQRVGRSNMDLSRALYTHSKILIAALNGPVFGIAAAYLGYFDLIYAHPSAWLAVPFSTIGIVAEGGSSLSFVQRMGVAKAKEVLFFGRKVDVNELVRCGFVNKIIDAPSTSAFQSAVRSYLEDLIQGLNPTALLQTKSLIQSTLKEQNNPDAVNVRETFAQADRFLSGEPYVVFGQLARKERKHRL